MTEIDLLPYIIASSVPLSKATSIDSASISGMFRTSATRHSMLSLSLYRVRMRSMTTEEKSRQSWFV